MEVQTALVLTIQLIALFSIAGALLLYLLCKVRGTRDDATGTQKGSILITCADTALGLQVSSGCNTHLNYSKLKLHSSATLATNRHANGVDNKPCSHLITIVSKLPKKGCQLSQCTRISWLLDAQCMPSSL